jgi:hypothetical protein
MRRSGHHVFLAVPTRGSIRWETVTRLQDVRDVTPGLRPILYQPGNLSVALTRNLIVRQFLASDCETLMMVDDDIVPPPHFVETLDRALPGYGMVAIPHVMPVGAESILTAFTGTLDGLRPCELGDGMNEVDAVATGCVAVSAAALEALGPDPFRIAHDPTATVTSDDFLFCADLRVHGFKVGAWWDGWPCDHVTTVSLAPIHERSARVHARA